MLLPADWEVQETMSEAAKAGGQDPHYVKGAFARIADPLRTLLKPDAKFPMTKLQEKAVDDLKDLVEEDHVLAVPDEAAAIEAAATLQTSYLRRIFIRAAIALVRADGVYSNAERHALGTIADAFGDPEWESFIQKKAKEYHAR